MVLVDGTGGLVVLLPLAAAFSSVLKTDGFQHPERKKYVFKKDGAYLHDIFKITVWGLSSTLNKQNLGQKERGAHPP